VPYASKEDFLKKVKILRLFQKKGLRGKKMKFLEKYVQIWKDPQKLDTKHEPHAPKRFIKKSKV